MWPRRRRPDPDLVALARRVYPLLLVRQHANVPLLKEAHRQLTEYARVHDLHEEEWPDMALRVMLEYERDA